MSKRLSAAEKKQQRLSPQETAAKAEMEAIMVSTSVHVPAPFGEPELAEIISISAEESLPAGEPAVLAAPEGVTEEVNVNPVAASANSGLSVEQIDAYLKEKGLHVAPIAAGPTLMVAPTPAPTGTAPASAPPTTEQAIEWLRGGHSMLSTRIDNIDRYLAAGGGGDPVDRALTRLGQNSPGWSVAGKIVVVGLLTGTVGVVGLGLFGRGPAAGMKAK